jgi:hypothetical protein
VSAISRGSQKAQDAQDREGSENHLEFKKQSLPAPFLTSFLHNTQSNFVCFCFAVLGIESRALSVLSKCSTI